MRLISSAGKCAPALLVYALMVSPAVARLNETFPKLLRRFGQPYHTARIAADATECLFHIRQGNFDVQVTLRGGKSIAETYFSTQPRQPNGEPPVEIVRGILQTNVPHARWADQPPRGGHEDSALITIDGRYGAWISNDGAWYNPNCTFVVGVYKVGAGNVSVTQSAGSTQISPTAAPTPTPTPLDPAVRAKLVADFNAEVTQLLAKAAAEPWLKNHPSSLDKVAALPPALAAAVRKADDDESDFRRKVGDDMKSLTYLRDAAAVVDSLKAYAEAADQLHSGNAVRAGETLDSFHQEYPAAPGSESKALWESVMAVRSMLDRLHAESKPHIEKASSLADAGKTGSAVQEYQRALHIFPDPAIAEQIKKLREESLGL